MVLFVKPTAVLIATILVLLEALPEQLQDFEERMVLIGSDVISLYPNLEVDKVVDNIREAVMMADVKWEEVDYREGVRYGGGGFY